MRSRSLVRVGVLSLILSALVGCARSQAVRPPDWPAAAALEVPVQQYGDAARAGAVGAIVGRAYDERRKPNAPDTPLGGTVVSLLPYSEPLRSRLEALKSDARDSMQGFRDAAPTIRQTRDDYETALWQRGGADLVVTTTADANGTFRLEGVPAGRWLVYATHANYVSRSGRGQTLYEQSAFTKNPKLRGFYWVTVWLQDVLVEPGASAAVELMDRNLWFTGIAEDWDTQPKPRRGGPNPQKMGITPR